MGISKKILSFMLIGVMSLGVAFSSPPSVDYYDVHYTVNAPASINKQSESLLVRYYNTGYVAKASTLTGASDRRIEIEGRLGYVIQNATHNIIITVANVITSSFTTNYIAPFGYSEFIVSALGNPNCVSTGFISINDSSIYNNA